MNDTKFIAALLCALPRSFLVFQRTYASFYEASDFATFYQKYAVVNLSQILNFWSPPVCLIGINTFSLQQLRCCQWQQKSNRPPIKSKQVFPSIRYELARVWPEPVFRLFPHPLFGVDFFHFVLFARQIDNLFIGQASDPNFGESDVAFPSARVIAFDTFCRLNQSCRRHLDDPAGEVVELELQLFTFARRHLLLQIVDCYKRFCERPVVLTLSGRILIIVDAVLESDGVTVRKVLYFDEAPHVWACLKYRNLGKV